MWPSSWYQFCVSLPLEVRTVGLVLFLQVLTLLSVKHCLPSAGHAEPVFGESVFTAAVRYSNCGLHNSTSNKKVMCTTPATTVRRYSRHDLLSLDTAATPFPSPQLIARLSHLGIARNVPRKPRRSRRGGRNERRTIKVIVGLQDRLLSEFSSSATPSPLPAEPDFKFSSGLQPHSDKRQHDHDTSATTLILSPNDRDLTTSSLSAPVRPTRRRLLRIPLHSFSTRNTLLVCLFNARSVGTSRRRSDISTFILDNNIDIMLLTETWLHPCW